MVDVGQSRQRANISPYTCMKRKIAPARYFRARQQRHSGTALAKKRSRVSDQTPLQIPVRTDNSHSADGDTQIRHSSRNVT